MNQPFCPPYATSERPRLRASTARLYRHFSDAAVGPNKSVCLCNLTPPQREWERTPRGVSALITPRRDGAMTVGKARPSASDDSKYWRSTLA